MDSSTAILISIGFLSLVSLGLAYRFLSRFCRREEVELPTVSNGNSQSSGTEQSNKCVQVATASPRLCSYKNRRFLASIPNLDRFLCNTLGWQEGVTLESGLDLSSRNQSKANTTTMRQPGHSGGHNEDDNGRGMNKNQDAQEAQNSGPNSNAQSCGTTSASTQTSRERVNSCTRNLAYSILNIVSAIPSISLGSFSQSQSLPNVHGYLAESVSTSTGSRDLVVLWSTTLESCDSGVLTSTRVE